MPAIPTPPPDNSGGYLVIAVSDGRDTHRMRLHVQPFSLTTFVTSSPEVDGPTDDGNHNYAYVNTSSPGHEMGVSDTYQAFVNAIKPFWFNTWSFSLVALYQTRSGAAPIEVFPAPVVSAIQATGTGGIQQNQSRASQRTFNFRSRAGGRAKVVLTGTNVDPTQIPVIVSPTSGGTAAEQGVVAYLSGASTGARCHDGGVFSPQARVTYVVNRRLRRHYGFA